jgi:hypothetical protein
MDVPTKIDAALPIAKGKLTNKKAFMIGAIEWAPKLTIPRDDAIIVVASKNPPHAEINAP